MTHRFAHTHPTAAAADNYGVRRQARKHTTLRQTVVPWFHMPEQVRITAEDPLQGGAWMALCSSASPRWAGNKLCFVTCDTGKVVSDNRWFIKCKAMTQITFEDHIVMFQGFVLLIVSVIRLRSNVSAESSTYIVIKNCY